MTHIVSNLIKDFSSLSKKYQIIIITLLAAGFIARFVNYFHLGYVYDLVSTQYSWAKNATDYGFISFWRNYQDSLDYLPGAIYVGMVVEYINKFFGLFGVGGNEYGFVFILKAFNTLNDFLLAFLLYIIGKKYTDLKGVRLFITPVLSFMLPSLWFISSVWGQFDTFPVNLSIITTLLLYIGQEKKNPRYGLLAGAVYGFAFWFKLQSILLLPPLILLFITFKNNPLFVRFISAFSIMTVSMLTVPFFANVYRTGFVLAQVVIRSNNVSNGASSFWPLVDMRKYGTDLWFSIGRIDITASRVSYLVYIISMVLLLLQLFPIFKTKSVLNPTTLWTKVMSLQPLSFLNFAYIMMVSSSVYFFFFTKMMSRYLHFGYLYALIVLTLQTNISRFKLFLAAILVTEIGYAINQMGIYGFYNSNPAWTASFEKGVFGIDKVWLASWFNLVGIAMIYILTIVFNKKNRPDA
jgi:Dolichyl-phosphate-mannose-protein mannosyltransferase